MSNSLASELDLDFKFLPSWAQQPADQNRFANYQDAEGSRPPRRSGGGGFGSGGGGRGAGPRRDRPEGGHGFRAPGGGRDSRPASREEGGDRHGFADRRESSNRLPEFNVNLIPDEKGVEMIARQIKLTGRSYPLFNIAQLVLKRPDRFHLKFLPIRKSDGKPSQSLWVCSLDESVWLSEGDATQRVFDKYFDMFYKPEQIPIDPPKGVYTFVAQCGMSGAILGPPNYHDYQTKLRRLHAERFSRMPFEGFKARVKIVRDEAVVKKWIDEQSFRTEYTCLNLPEAVKLSTREEVEKHFKEVHAPNILKQVDSLVVNDLETRHLLPQPLQTLARMAWEDQKRFPLKLVTLLSQQLAGHGLQFFKVNKTVTHVSVSRPRFLDMEATPVSDGVKRIVDFINSRNKPTRKMLLETLAPSPSAKAAPAAEMASGASGPAEIPARELSQPTPEQSAIIADLHWLVHQGNVIEFADGRLETAKRPLPKPARQPEKKPAPAAPGSVEAASETPAVEQGSAAESVGDSEVTRSEFSTSEETSSVSVSDPESGISDSQKPSSEAQDSPTSSSSAS